VVKAVDGIAFRLLPGTEVFGIGTVAYIEIEKSVLVVIQEGGATPHRLHQVIHVVVSGGMDKVHPQIRGDLLKKVAVGFRNGSFRCCF
jgi:hypothetical protein